MNEPSDAEQVPHPAASEAAATGTREERPSSAWETSAPEHGPDALARLSDPSLRERRARAEELVRDRSRLQWIPVSELLRSTSTRVGTAVARGQELTHRAVRDATGRTLRTATVAVRDRPRRLGAAHTTARTPDLGGRRAVGL